MNDQCNNCKIRKWCYQEEPEDPDAVRRIPMLARGDIGKEAKKFTTREEEVDGSTLLYHEVDTNGIG